jgi:hypothetical protein
LPFLTVNGKETNTMSAKVVPLKPKPKTVPSIENRKIAPPRRKRNADVSSPGAHPRPKWNRLMEAAWRIGRHRHRDRTPILMLYRHALRVSRGGEPAVGHGGLGRNAAARPTFDRVTGQAIEPCIADLRARHVPKRSLMALPNELG